MWFVVADEARETSVGFVFAFVLCGFFSLLLFAQDTRGGADDDVFTRRVRAETIGKIFLEDADSYSLGF